MNLLKKYFLVGTLGLALGIALGAFGAHGLKDIVSEKMLANYETGVRYQMYSALAIMIIAIVASFKEELKKPLSTSCLLIMLGAIIFSGSLYVMALTGMTFLGAITPIGGVLMIVGLLMTSYIILKKI